MFRKYLIKLTAFILYFSFFLSFGHANDESNARSDLVSEATSWLQDALETDAPIGEVFRCSVAQAVSAVEEAIGRLGGTS